MDIRAGADLGLRGRGCFQKLPVDSIVGTDPASQLTQSSDFPPGSLQHVPCVFANEYSL